MNFRLAPNRPANRVIRFAALRLRTAMREGLGLGNDHPELLARVTAV